MALVDIVSVVVAEAVPFGVIVVAERLQVASEGKPEQANETGGPKPFTGPTDAVTVPLCPDATERDDALNPNVKTCAD